MRRQIAIGVPLLLAACAGAQPAERPRTDAGAEAATTAVVAPDSAPPPPPARATVTLGLDRTSFFLGENVLVHYCLVNTSEAPLTIEVGGDYRGASRSLRFETTVTDARGAVVPDPDPERYSMGGLGYSPVIAPGASWCQSLPLVHYARIDAPGRYTVRVVHDLGWPKGTAPAGETSVTFTAPTAAEAEGVVRAMEALPKDPNRSAGQKNGPYADFTTLRHGMYLAPLLARATQGSPDALAGLASIPTADTTRALVKLLGHPQPEVARGAASALALRLPDPALQGGTATALGVRNPFFNELPEQRKYLIAAAWTPDLADDVRAAARRLLAGAAPGDVKAGAFMLEAVGTKDDAADLVVALTRAIERTTTTPRETNIAPTPREACQELLRAAKVLVLRGVPAPARTTAPGELALWLVAKDHAQALGEKASEATFARALSHPILYLRRVAMERAPKPLAPALVAAVRANLASTDIDTQLAAAWLAESQQLTALAPDLVSVIARTKDAYLLGVATRAAEHLGARGTRIDALVSRLTDTALGFEVLDRLLDSFGSNGRSAPNEVTPAQALALQAAWRAFVKQHRADLEAGRKLELDASTPAALVPPGFIVHRPDQPNWPAGR
jgi:hypothetical protein